jgi:hypothetical protein
MSERVLGDNSKILSEITDDYLNEKILNVLLNLLMKTKKELSLEKSIHSINKSVVNETDAEVLIKETNTEKVSEQQQQQQQQQEQQQNFDEKRNIDTDVLDYFLEKNNITDLGTHSRRHPKEIEFIKQFTSKKNIKTVLEVGFGAGHLADTILNSNENVTIVSFDIATNPFTMLGKEYIDKKYPGRHTMIEGDSRKTILNYFQQNPEQKFDIIFIHGGHYGNIPKMDLTNCRLLAKKSTIVIMNDVNYKNIEMWNIKPNEAWDTFIENNYIDEIKKKEFSPLNSLVYGKYNLCEVFICSLLRPDRMKYIEENIKMFPFIKTFKSINGYNPNIPLKEIINLKLKYKDLDNNFRTYGTLANWITKYKMLKHQVEHEIPYMCFLEDDLILESNFYTFICDSLKHFKTNVNMLRLMTWGEGYITSYESAKRTLEHLDRDGITRNIDNQLRENCGYEIALEKTPMKLMVIGNNGDCLKTGKFENAEIYSKLQKMSSKK